MLNESKGNMYEFVTHTWNPIKGKCGHDCEYCFMKKTMRRFNKEMSAPRLDEKEVRTNLGEGNYIFVGSSTDMWAQNISSEWIHKVLNWCMQFDNKYIFQTKNPQRFMEFCHHPVFEEGKAVVCTTIETDGWFTQMGCAPSPNARHWAMMELRRMAPMLKQYVTCEPLMRFNMGNMLYILKTIRPEQINIGRNSYRQIELPEPEAKDVQYLVTTLREMGFRVEVKKNARCWAK